MGGWQGLGDTDPTAYDLNGDQSLNDPRVRRLNAVSNYGRFPLRMPFMTQVTDDLWHGGVETGLELPEFVDYKLSLYQWEDYIYPADKKVETLTVEMYDHVDQEFDQIEELATWVNERRKKGVVFVHCQAGINRSSLVVAKALVMNGDVANGQEAIDLIRSKRDRACLANPAFEKWVKAL